jgi:hypothetical protein
MGAAEKLVADGQAGCQKRRLLCALAPPASDPAGVAGRHRSSSEWNTVGVALRAVERRGVFQCSWLRCRWQLQGRAVYNTGQRSPAREPQIIDWRLNAMKLIWWTTSSSSLRGPGAKWH